MMAAPWSDADIVTLAKKRLLFRMPTERAARRVSRGRDVLLAVTWLSIGILVAAMFFLGVGVAGKP